MGQGERGKGIYATLSRVKTHVKKHVARRLRVDKLYPIPRALLSLSLPLSLSPSFSFLRVEKEGGGERKGKRKKEREFLLVYRDSVLLRGKGATSHETNLFCSAPLTRHC